MSDFSHLTARDEHQRPQPMLRDQARHHAQLLRAAADLLLAGEPVAWVTGGFGSGLRGVSYAFDAAVFEEAAVHVRERVQSGDEDYTIRVTPRPPARYPQRKRR